MAVPSSTLNLFDVRYFIETVDGGSLQAGARRAHVTPPAMTKAMQRLEGALGVRLLSRSPQGARLTGDGQRLVPALRALLEQADRVTGEALDGGSALRGELRILAMEVFSPFLLPKAIKNLLAAHPALFPKTYESIPERMVELVGSGRADVAFTIGRVRSPTVRVTKLGTTPGVLVCGRTHPLARRRRRRTNAEDVARHPSVVPRFWGAEHLPSLDQFPDERWTRRVGATIELLRMGVRLVEEGCFLGYFPEISVRHELSTGSLHRLESPPADPFELVAMLPARGARPAAEGLVAEVLSLVGTESERRSVRREPRRARRRSSPRVA